jgi:hypothetical protein
LLSGGCSDGAAVSELHAFLLQYDHIASVLPDLEPRSDYSTAED